MKIFNYLVIVAGVVLAVVFAYNTLTAERMIMVVRGNHTHEPLEVKINGTQDAYCGMVIESLEFGAQVVAPDGRTWFFHDLGGVAPFLAGKEYEKTATVWVYQNDKKIWLDGRKAFYSRTENTPMYYGFGAYEEQKEGFVDFETMSQMMIRGENLTNPAVKKRLLDDK